MSSPIGSYDPEVWSGLEQSTNNNKLWWMILGGGIFITIILIIVFMYIKRTKNKKDNQT